MIFVGLGLWFWPPPEPTAGSTLAEAPVLPVETESLVPNTDKPSIAVLPFANLSGEPEQESFADGISEDLTTQLSKISGLFVISRTTAFQYKDRTADIQQLARDLGVRYVVEGSVRRAGDQIRINAQLIDAVTGGHLWAETYNGGVDDVFALQDRINGKIVVALKVHLTPEEEQRLVYRGTEIVAAYDAFLRGERLRLHGKTRPYEAAEREYNRAIALDPNFSSAYAGLSHIIWERARTDTSGHPREELSRARELAEKSIAIGDDPLGHAMLARIYLWDKFNVDQSESEAHRAVAIDPNNSESLATLAEVLIYAGRLREARSNLENAMRLDPNFPDRYSFLLGQSYFHDKKYQDALDHISSYCANLVRGHSQNPCRYYQASAYGHLGEIEAGREIFRKRAGFGFNLQSAETRVTLSFPFKNDASREQLMEGIRRVLPNR